MDQMVVAGIMLVGLALPLCGVMVIIHVVGVSLGLWEDE